jgi:hypothetical protein
MEGVSSLCVRPDLNRDPPKILPPMLNETQALWIVFDEIVEDLTQSGSTVVEDLTQ